MEDRMIRTRKDLEDLVEQWGFLPFFANSIPGFSVEEKVDPDLWFSDEPGPWEWKGPVIRSLHCGYGKFFEKKAAFISEKWFPDFANYRRSGYDFDARFEDGLATMPQKRLYDLLEGASPILSADLKNFGQYRKGGFKGFDTLITNLQYQGYACISDFIYRRDALGRTYGWGVAQYSIPEIFFGDMFTDHVYDREPEESFGVILEHFRNLFPTEPEANLIRFLDPPRQL